MAERERSLSERIMDAITHGFGRQRYLQSSPILPDVWDAYVQPIVERIETGQHPPPGGFPPIRVDLLLSTSDGSEPGAIAIALRRGIAMLHPDPNGMEPKEVREARIARNRSTVAANLTFEELVCIAIPLTHWWQTLPDEMKTDSYHKELLLRPFVSAIEAEFAAFMATVGLIGNLLEKPDANYLNHIADELARAESLSESLEPLMTHYRRLFEDFEFRSQRPAGATIARIQLNRSGSLTVFSSRQTIKADACYNLFATSVRDIRWAVMDCGIDAGHAAFRPEAIAPQTPPQTPPQAGKPFASRVEKTFDFTFFRELVSGARTVDAAGRDISADDLKELGTGGEIQQLDWSIIRRLTEIPHLTPISGIAPAAGEYRQPKADHGTHVAGIIGANWAADPNGNPVRGICPDIRLVDIRVFDGNVADEFSVMAALQFISHLNRISEVAYIHGVNVSFSFAHDVRNYACGRTPICMECERLVDNGTVVVAAAGNSGYDQKSSRPSLADRYAQISITDPGNAEAVITVGSTHRTQPHSYGVSFFSSRGPTGDGRSKPDLIAPGEKILSTIRNNQSAEMDGTSMAAPHVSGAAAILMARNPELMGRAREVKRILCQTATDLGRERYFQGAGLVDVLRALQSI